jgi:hypothetical protein
MQAGAPADARQVAATTCGQITTSLRVPAGFLAFPAFACRALRLRQMPSQYLLASLLPEHIQQLRQFKIDYRLQITVSYQNECMLSNLITNKGKGLQHPKHQHINR